MAYPTLLIHPADRRIGHELARLAVAYGAQVYGVTTDGESPSVDEPWVHGVEWLEAIPDELTIDAAVMLDVEVLDDPLPRSDRIVLLNPPPGVQQAGGDETIVATCGSIHEGPIKTMSDASPTDGIRVERLAMALLRAALDVDIPDALDEEALHRLGDAVFLQRGS